FGFYFGLSFLEDVQQPLFLCLGQKWSLFGHFDPKMTPKRKNNCGQAADFSTVCPLFVDKSCAAGR
ncbi:MAG: hypothetical protein ACLS5S_02700, partial [Faecalibacterium sp.]|nr:hypothetical protein [Gemmiger formicilis]